jgi:hypothetical protein
VGKYETIEDKLSIPSRKEWLLKKQKLKQKESYNFKNWN